MHRRPGAWQPHVRRAVSAGAAAAAALAAALPAAAQRTPAGAEGRTLWLQSSLSVQETLTNNGDLDRGNGGGRRADAITQVTPMVRLASRGGRVRADVDYSPTALIYARSSSHNEIQNNLNALVDSTLIDNRLFLAGRATVSQRTISAFGTQSGRSTLANDNRSEVATLSVSPSLRGSIAGVVDYGVTGSWMSTRAASTKLGDVDSGSLSAFLGGNRGRFGWSVQAQHTADDYAASRKTTQDNATARLTWSPIYDLRFGVSGGREWTDVQTGQRESNARYGLSAEWTPSERTQLSVLGEKRYFGHSHAINFVHRRASSVWSYSDTRDVSSSPTQQGLTAVRLSDLFAGIEPDRDRRDAILRNAGYDPNSVGTLGFLAASLSEQRQQNLAVAYIGLRATVTLSVARTESHRFSRFTTVFDDLSSASRVRQQAMTLGVLHRLTPTASIGGNVTLQRTFDAGPVAGDQRREFSLTWVDRVGPRTNVSLSLRHSQADGNSANQYGETAAIGALSVRF